MTWDRPICSGEIVHVHEDVPGESEDKPDIKYLLHSAGYRSARTVQD